MTDERQLETKEEKAVVPAKTNEEIRDCIRKSKTLFDPDVVFHEVGKELNDKEGKQEVLPKTNTFKAMTLFEFENGVLMSTTIAEQYKTFGIDMLRQLQKEYRCEGVSEKATAELVAVSYIRTLEIQHRINNYLELGTITTNGVGFLNIMSKELDRANRHYLTALQTLRTLKEQPLQVTFKTNTAIIGQNQIVQANSNEQFNKPK